MKVCVGGTFDPFHKGHETLINKAFEIGTEIFIGLTSDEMAQSYRTLCVSPYENRKINLENYIKKMRFTKKTEIVVLDNRFGPSIIEDFEAIIVSPETKPVADKLNKIRNEKGLNAIKIIKVPYVLAQDGVPISSTRIKNGEIDADGKMLREILINIGSINNLKIESTKQVFTKFFDKVSINGYNIKSKVTEIPFGDEIIKGAVNRAKNVLENADFGVGIEAGIYFNKQAERHFCLHYCAIIDKMDRITIGNSSGFEIPNDIISRIKKGKSLEEILKNLSSSINYEKNTQTQFITQNGMIHYFSKGLVKREKLIYESVLSAFIPRIRLCF